MSSIALISCGADLSTKLSGDLLSAIANRFCPAGTTGIFMKAKETVRAKRARVNSVFLVQLRKRVGADFRGSIWMKEQVRSGRLSHWMALVFGERLGCGENLVEWAAGISTEGAQEMQKGEVSRFQGFMRRGDARSCLAR